MSVTGDASEEQRIREGLEKSKTSQRHSQADEVESSEVSARKASFEQAQSLGEELATVLSTACAAGEPMPAEAQRILRALISTTAGARGWFVSLLTNPDFDAIFQPPIYDAILDAICETVSERGFDAVRSLACHLVTWLRVRRSPTLTSS